MDSQEYEGKIARMAAQDPILAKMLVKEQEMNDHDTRDQEVGRFSGAEDPPDPDFIEFDMPDVDYDENGDPIEEYD